jgi:hypothetical protein
VDVSYYALRQRPKGLEQFRRKFMLNAFKVKCKVAGEEDLKRTRDRFDIGHVAAKLITIARKKTPGFTLGYAQEKMPIYDTRYLKLPDNTYVDGYWQSEKYFINNAEVIRDEMGFVNPALEEYAKAYVKKLRASEERVVALHVRRGDLAFATEKLGNPDLVYGPPTSLEYVEMAMREFGCRHRFLIFSESEGDLGWCRDHIQGNRVHYCEGHTDLEDFAIMRQCDDLIIANSTFSWWAAWLGNSREKKVIAPRIWFNSQQSSNHRMEDLIPEKWKMLP